MILHLRGEEIASEWRLHLREEGGHGTERRATELRASVPVSGGGGGGPGRDGWCSSQACSGFVGSGGGPSREASSVRCLEQSESIRERPLRFGREPDLDDERARHGDLNRPQQGLVVGQRLRVCRAHRAPKVGAIRQRKQHLQPVAIQRQSACLSIRTSAEFKQIAAPWLGGPPSSPRGAVA